MKNKNENRIEDNITETVTTVASKVNKTVNDTGDKIRGFLGDEDTVQQIKNAAADLNQFVQKNPWTSVLGALAIGYVVGSFCHKRRY